MGYGTESIRFIVDTEDVSNLFFSVLLMLPLFGGFVVEGVKRKIDWLDGNY
jgi:hypothetical protein